MFGDIGIDLGTASVLIYSGRRILLKEPSVVAVDTRSNTIISIGKTADEMIGRTPDHIAPLHPLSDGVISKYGLAEIMLKYYLRKATRFFLFKPRIAMCVPSGVTEVEAKAVIEAAYAAGARKVFLIDEPVAAAIGSGLDISKPCGTLIIDIGGGTTDVALLSLNGIVSKASVKIAGNKFDEAIINQIREKYNVVIGQKTAEHIKMNIATVLGFDDNRKIEIRGRSLHSNLPKQLNISWRDFFEPLCDLAKQIALCVRSVLEQSPPDLVGDLKSSGFLLTGGGSLLHGLDIYLQNYLGAPVKLADRPLECVAIGAGKVFSHPDLLIEGFASLPKYDDAQFKKLQK